MTQLRKQDTGEEITFGQFRERNPNVGGNPIVYADFGYDVIFPAPQPTFDPITHYARALPAVLTPLGTYQQAWEVVALDAETVAANQAAATARFIVAVTNAAQSRLDAFAQTRNYDGILSACTYAASTVPKFQTEGQYCVNARDSTWATLYTIMGEVQAGTRAMPASVDAVMALLPALEWPA